ncbi:MAG: CD225/dispanin family protein [Anaerolineae bacterium]|nr:CD225/dispanin family protein [Anaerolineae bacterium]MDW8071430.1 hypothetical protein [Anaerolineae bacterium]
MSTEDHIVDLGPEDARPVSPSGSEELPEEAQPTQQPHIGPALCGSRDDTARASFIGNAYDLAALGALGSGVLALLSCVTCNMVYYCLPLLPIALGIVGLVAAEQSVNARRTRIWSWIGVAAGILIILVMLAAVVLYFIFIALMLYMGYTDKLD